MSEEMVEPLTIINSKLDALPTTAVARCCTRSDYSEFLTDIRIDAGRIFVVSGASGYVALKGSLDLYSAEQLASMAESIRKRQDLFELNMINTQAPHAVSAVKLPGGAQTGYLVYIRPIDSLELIKRIERIRLEYELATLILLSVVTGVCIWLALRPIRQLKSQISGISWMDLSNAGLSVDKQPLEVRPLLTEFNEMLQRLNQAAENQRLFSAALSHEFRTPATVVSGFIQTVLNKPGSLDRSQIRALEIANNETLRMTRMLSDLLDLSRSDSNQLAIRKKPFYPAHCISEVVTQAQQIYDNEFAIDYSGCDSALAMGDSDRFRQCLSNVIENATKYSPPGSLITLRMLAHEQEVIVSVTDVGQGISTEQQERIFLRFQRAEGSVARSGMHSSGLGLAVVKMLMEAMDGCVEVESEPTRGSCFRLRLAAVGFRS